MSLKKFDVRQDYYAVLGVSETASKADVDRAYRRRARKSHPDGGGSDEEMKSLNEARDVLSDPETRQAYDAERRPSRTSYPSAAEFDPEAASRAGTLNIPVKDPDLAGLLMSAAACFGVGIPLLLLVEMQWMFFLWPLRILSLGAIVVGVFLSHSALVMKRRKLLSRSPDYSRAMLLFQETVFWILAVGLIGAIVVSLYVI